MCPEPHEARQIAESFGSDAERYDRARPGYPPELVTRIVAASPGRKVLDVGIGTGIAARAFRVAGCHVLGVDVDARMAEVARRDGFAVEVATFEEWQPDGRLFDIVIAGQTWHWIDPRAGAAKAATSLRPTGRLAAFWNVDQPPADLAQAFGDIYRRRMPDSIVAARWNASSEDGPSRAALDGYTRITTAVGEGIVASAGFEPPEQWRFDWEQTYTTGEWLDYVPTTGDHGQLPPAQLRALLSDLGRAIDVAGGSFTVRYATLVVTAARKRARSGGN
jgi:SAM-dependent methyltransferase